LEIVRGGKEDNKAVCYVSFLNDCYVNTKEDIKVGIFLTAFPDI